MKMKKQNVNPKQMAQIECSLFDQVTLPLPDPNFGIAALYFKDSNKEKINLSIGAYRDQKGRPYVFQIVQKVQNQLVKQLNKQYLLDGLQSFCSGAQRVIFGKENPILKEQRIASFQSLSGTGALFLGFTFISKFKPMHVYISNPTWPNHKNIIDHVGLTYSEYPYYNETIKKFDFQRMKQFLNEAKDCSLILLQTMGHNPSGCDPSQQQWKQICAIIKNKNMFPFFDSAYQGFVSGDLDRDAWVIRYFLDQGLQMFVAQSFAKNMGLYGQRIGALHVVTNNKQASQVIYARLNNLARMVYSTPPSHGAFIVDKILNNQQNYNAWVKQLRQVVSARINKVRYLLREKLQKINAPGNWAHITDQLGMFTFTGLTQKQCSILIQKYHIYLIKSGRISLAGINEQNVDRIAFCIKEAILESEKSEN